MAYDVTWGKNTSLFTFFDKTDIYEVNRANGTLHGSRNYQHYHCSIWNFLDCDTSNITKEDVKQPAYITRASTLSVQYIKKALVARDIYALGLCHEFATLFQNLEASGEVRIFTSLDAAQQWCNPEKSHSQERSSLHTY